MEKYIDIIPPLNIQFDETNNYIFYSSILGIKLIDIRQDKLIKILGKSESSERFLTLVLFQGKSLRVKKLIFKIQIFKKIFFYKFSYIRIIPD